MGFKENLNKIIKFFLEPKISLVILYFFVGGTSLIFILNYLILQQFLFSSFSNELTGRWTNRTENIGVQADELIQVEGYAQLISFLFDNKHSRTDFAYLFVADNKKKIIASTFIGDINELMVSSNPLPDGGNIGTNIYSDGNNSYYDVAYRLKWNSGILHAGYYMRDIDSVISNAKSILGISIIIPGLLALFFGYWLTKILVSPIKRLYNASKKVAEGDLNQYIRNDRKDEIGDLSGIFNIMTKNLRESRDTLAGHKDSLEKEVKTKTKALQETLSASEQGRRELEKQGKAMLNILDDMYESEESLKSANLELKQKRYELEELNSISDEMIGVLNIQDAISALNCHLEKMLDYSVTTLLVIDPLKKGDIIFQANLKDQVSENFFEVIKRELMNFLSYYDMPGIDLAEKTVKNATPAFTGIHPDKTAEEKGMSTAIFPLNIGEEMVGALHIASYKADFYKKESQREFIKAIVSAFSMAIARLQVLNKIQQSKTESLVRSLSDGVLMFDMDGKITLANASVNMLFLEKKQPENISSAYNLFKDVDMANKVATVLGSGESEHIFEVSIGNKIFEAIIIAVKDFNGLVVGGAFILHDITKIKEVDRMKSEFVSVASHQLRTPLTAIKLFSEMMLDGQVGEINGDQKDYISNIHLSTERMVRLVNDLLNLSRLEDGRLRIDPQPTDISELIRSIITEADPVAHAKGCSISFAPKAEIGRDVSVDPNLLRQVVHNLVTNAIRYCSAKNGKADIIFEEKGDDYRIAVRDNGIGIAKKDQSRIFGKFFRADNAVKVETDGSGLGLYVCKMIMETAGGTIGFISDEGKGSEFYITFPRTGFATRQGDRTIAT